MWKITSPPQATSWNIQNPALKNYVPSFSKHSTFLENIRISWLKSGLTLEENYTPEFKPLIENLQENLHKGKRKQ